MTGGVDMGACMIAHGKSKRGSREGVAIGFADLRVGGVGCDDYRGMVQQSRHFVVDVAAKVDEGHGVGSQAAVGERRVGRSGTIYRRDMPRNLAPNASYASWMQGAPPRG